MHLSPMVHALLAHQHGIVSREQLVGCGITARQIHRLLDDGVIESVLRDAYRSPSVPLGEYARCAAVCLARPDVVIAGPTAGRLWTMRRMPPDRRIHVVSPPASNPSIAPWVVPYRTAAIHATDVVYRDDGIRVTSRARTAFDLTRFLRPDDLLSVIEQAMHDGRLDEGDMWAVAADWVTPGRPWVRRYVRQLARRLQGGAAESHPEVRVAVALAEAGVHGLVRQYAIHLPGYGRARFDLAMPRQRWAIEIDVHPRHEETAGAATDARRDDCARLIGWTTTRIDRATYLQRFDAAIQQLVEIAAQMRLREDDRHLAPAS